MNTDIHFLLHLAQFFLEWEMFQTKVVEKIKTHILCYSVTFFFFENRAVYEIIWKNIVQQGTPQMIIWHMRVACWIPKATNIHSQYAILTAFALQQWLHERASMLLYTYIACIAITETGCVYCAVRTALLNVIKVNIILLRVNRVSVVCKSCNIAVLHNEVSTFRLSPQGRTPRRGKALGGKPGARALNP